jgi:hypothetical protein
MPLCPNCSSDKVYRLLETLRCKRCKHIWKEEERDPDSTVCRCPIENASFKIRKRTEPLERRMERKLDEYLARSKGKFCFTLATWQAGDISQELFTRYLRRCLKDRTLAETRDRYGRTWYSRPG